MKNALLVGCDAGGGPYTKGMICIILNLALPHPQMMRLTCGEGMVLGNVKFASFGRPDGRWPDDRHNLSWLGSDGTVVIVKSFHVPL